MYVFIKPEGLTQIFRITMSFQMILSDNAEAQRKTLEKKYEDMSQRLRDADRRILAMQKEITKYQAGNLH